MTSTPISLRQHQDEQVLKDYQVRLHQTFPQYQDFQTFEKYCGECPLIFSFDSILTAIGLVDEIVTMILAVIISMLVMLAAAKSVSDFVNRNPTIKMLALAFLLMIGFMLVVEAFDVHVPKGYIYFAMAFSLIVELLNQQVRKKS